jgi:hypothetical protein
VKKLIAALKNIIIKIATIGQYQNAALGISVNWSPWPFSWLMFIIFVVMLFLSIVQPTVFSIVMCITFLVFSIGFLIFSHLLTKNFIKHCEKTLEEVKK